MDKGKARLLAIGAVAAGLYGAARGVGDVGKVISEPSAAEQKAKKEVEEKRHKEEAAKLNAEALKKALMEVEERRERHTWEMHRMSKIEREEDRKEAEEAADERTKEKKEEAAQRLAAKLGDAVDRMAAKAFNKEPFGPPERHDWHNTKAKDALAKHAVEEAFETYGEWDGTTAEPAILHCLRELARFNPSLFQMPKGFGADKFRNGAFVVSAENTRHVDKLTRRLRELRRSDGSKGQIEDVQRKLASATALHQTVEPFLYPNPEPPPMPRVKARPRGQKVPRNKGAGGGKIISI